MQSRTLIVLLFAALFAIVYGTRMPILRGRARGTFGNNLYLENCYMACAEYSKQLKFLEIEEEKDYCNCLNATEKTVIFMNATLIERRKPGEPNTYLPCTTEILQKRLPCASI